MVEKSSEAYTASHDRKSYHTQTVRGFESPYAGADLDGQKHTAICSTVFSNERPRFAIARLQSKQAFPAYPLCVRC